MKRIFGILGFLAVCFGVPFLLSLSAVSVSKDYHIGIASTAQGVKKPACIEVRNRSGTPTNEIAAVKIIYECKDLDPTTYRNLTQVTVYTDPDFLHGGVLDPTDEFIGGDARASPIVAKADVVYNSADVGGVSGNDGLVRIRTG